MVGIAWFASLVWCVTAHAAGWVMPAATIYAGSGVASTVRSGSTAEDAHGNVFATWLDLHTGDTYVSERPAGGPFPASAAVVTSGSDAGAPIVVDAAGDAIIVWTDSSGVLHGEQQAPGGSFQPLVVPTTTGAQTPELAAAGNGSVILVWSQGNELMYSMRLPGGSFGPGATVPNSTDPYGFAVTMDAAGDAAIAFVINGGLSGTWSVMAGYWDHTGSGFDVPSTPLYTLTGSSMSTVFIDSLGLSMSPAGATIATWEPSCTGNVMTSPCSGASSTYSALYESIRKAGTTTSFATGTSLASSTSGAFAYWDPTTAFDGSGNAVIAWAFNPTTSFEIDQAQVPVANGAVTPVTPVSTQATSLGAQVPYLSMASLSSGAVVIAYSSSDNTQVSAAIRPNGALGTAFGTSTQISDVPGSSTTIDEDSIQIATSGGDAFVSWILYNTPTLEGAAYAGNPPAVTVKAPATATVGKPVSITASALGNWTPASVTGITFGDGASTLGASASHSYAKPGTYTIRAIATDGSGNTGTGTAQIVVSGSAPGSSAAKRCVVSKVIGKTLAAARRAITRDGCRVGHVSRPRRGRHAKPAKLVVRSQSPRPGRRVALGTKVNLTLGPAPKSKRA
jgi:PKD domain